MPGLDVWSLNMTNVCTKYARCTKYQRKTVNYHNNILHTSVSTGRDVLLSLCPGTKKNICPGVPLSRDKGRSKNSRTKWIKKTIKKRTRFFCFRTSPSCFRTSFPVLERPFCSVPLCHAFRPEFWLSRPVLFQILALPSRTLARFIACPVVPLSRKVALSRPVGNTNAYRQSWI